jgi:hypothetical protein
MANEINSQQVESYYERSMDPADIGDSCSLKVLCAIAPIFGAGYASYMQVRIAQDKLNPILATIGQAARNKVAARLASTVDGSIVEPAALAVLSRRVGQIYDYKLAAIISLLWELFSAQFFM